MIDLIYLYQSIKRQQEYEIRTALTPDGSGTYTLQSFIAAPPSREPEQYNHELFDFGKVLFTVVEVDIQQLLQGLEEIKNNKLVPHFLTGLPSKYTVSFNLLTPKSDFQHNRVNSKSTWIPYSTFDFPYDLFALNTSVSDKFYWNNGPVNKKGLPFFHSYIDAAYQYLFKSQKSIHNVNNASVFNILVPDERGRIEGVIIGQKSIQILLGGDKITDCEVKLSGREPEIIEVLPAINVLDQSLTFNTLPRDLTVVLSLEDEILDIRNPLNQFSNQVGNKDVQEAEEEPIENFIAWHGESLTIEYKSEFGKEVAKSIVGFANAEGGSLFFGVKDDIEGIKIVGIDNIDELKCSIQNIIDRTTGHFEHRIEVHTIQDKKIVRLIVEESDEKPIALLDGSEQRFYIRRDGSTRKIRREDILSWTLGAEHHPKISF